jgi:hypothetical protein
LRACLIKPIWVIWHGFPLDMHQLWFTSKLLHNWYAQTVLSRQAHNYEVTKLVNSQVSFSLPLIFEFFFHYSLPFLLMYIKQTRDLLTTNYQCEHKIYYHKVVLGSSSSLCSLNSWSKAEHNKLQNIKTTSSK